MAEYDLSGKVALVTGAGRGIGLETARHLHRRGASVVMADVTGDVVEDSAEGVGGRAVGIEADVRDASQVEAAVALAVERFGGLDIAVANAGIAPKGVSTLRSTETEEWERIVDVNLLGVWRTARAALPHVVERRGQVVVVSSVYAFVNGTGNSAYAVAKAGVESMGRSLRAELAPHGASATVAYFGFIDTKMVKDALDEDPMGARFIDSLPKFVAKRLTPDAAGAAIVAGVEKRAPRVFAPSWWRYVSALRGMVNPLADRRMESDANLRSVVLDSEVADEVTKGSAAT